MRHTSSCASRWYLSGPLQIGHARISSRRESMEQRYLSSSADHGIYAAAQLAGDRLEQLGGMRVAEPRGDRHVPDARIRERPAFYGIFLGHEHGLRVAEVQVRGTERVMIRERV